MQRGADPGLLDTYEAERAPVARHVLGLSTRLAATVTSTSTQGMVARDEDTFQLGIHYRESPLSQDLRAAPGRVRAGDRAPDAPALQDCTGGSCALFDVFRGPRATLVAFGEAWLPSLRAARALAGDDVLAACIVDAAAISPDSGAVRVLADTEGHAAAAYDPGEGALFVVRPDGVVGFACDRPDDAALAAWLRRAGLVR